MHFDLFYGFSVNKQPSGRTHTRCHCLTLAFKQRQIFIFIPDDDDDEESFNPLRAKVML